MPFLGTSLHTSYVAIPQHSFQSYLATSRDRPFFHVSTSNKFSSANGKRLGFSWLVSYNVSRTLKFDCRHLDTPGALLVKAVSTFETKYLVDGKDGQRENYNLHLGPHMKSHFSLPSGGDPALPDEREMIRRMRISKANKGKVPWNKGRKHSAETLRRIKERTKLAMQDPKVKMKLVNLGHAQSEETRVKIGIGVRMGWQRRREKLLVQETCYFEWQNLIAEASREGYSGEEVLQWDSYRLLDEKLAREWLDSIEQRKLIPRPKGSKRAPKSLEQRRKISEAISAKWADLGYRERVCSGLHQYHGINAGVKRKPRRKPVEKIKSERWSPVKKKVSDASNTVRSPTKGHGRSGLKRTTEPSYKDPSANSKLELLKNIRAQREAMETKKREAMERAKLLIVEAEKAAIALEVAAAKSPLAQASVLETRKLIAEATKSLEGIEAGQLASHESANSYSSADLKGLVNDFENLSTENNNREVNETHVLFSSDIYSRGFNIGEFPPMPTGDTSSKNLLNSKEPPSSGEPLPSIQSHETKSMLNSRVGGDVHSLLSPLQLQDPMVPVPTDKQVVKLEPNGIVTPLPNGDKVQLSKTEEASTCAVTRKKKWVCGRLVEVDEQG